MATYSSIFAWKIPWAEEPGRLWAMGSQELDTTERLTHASSELASLIIYQQRKTEERKTI